MKIWFPVLALCGLAIPVAAQDFHTDPSCWTKPRLYHAGPPSPDMARRIEVTPNVTRKPRENAVLSPNGAYKLWIELPNDPVGNVADQVVYIDSEQDRVTRVYIEQAMLPLTPQWVNEKLVFVRIPWGRIAFTDMLIDAETGEIIYQEEARAGDIAYQQYQQVCGKSCPCDTSILTTVAPPRSAPAEGEVIGYLQIDGFLNADQATRQAELEIHVDVNGQKIEIMTLDAGRANMILTDDRKDWQSALVYAREPGWYQIMLSGEGHRKVWIQDTNSLTYSSRPERWRDSLSYLNANWDGRLWADPSGDGGYVQSSVYQPGQARPEYAVNIIDIRQTDAGPWLQVTLHHNDDCQRSQDTIVAKGWVPAWSTAGEAVADYYPGGC